MPISDIREALIQSLLDRGIDRDISEITADEYLDGELMGKKSHGLMAFPTILQKYDQPKDRSTKILKETESMIFLDADELPGAYIGRRLVKMLAPKANKQGIAIGYITNMVTWLRPGTIAHSISSEGMVGYVINNGGSSMIAPPGGYDPVVGTNPIGIGIPTQDEPIVADMATSVRAWGEVRKAKAKGTDLPDNAFYDSTGRVTRDPETAHSAIGIGDYKGFALSLFAEVMTGSFLSRPMGLTGKQDDYRSTTRGGMILVCDPSLTTDPATFLHENSQLAKQIRQTPPKPGEHVTLPGDRARTNRDRYIKEGVLEVDEEVWNQIISQAS